MRECHAGAGDRRECHGCRTAVVNALVAVEVVEAAEEDVVHQLSEQERARSRPGALWPSLWPLESFYDVMSGRSGNGAAVSRKGISALWSSWSGLLHRPPTS
jgi:hypothetical protein